MTQQAPVQDPAATPPQNQPTPPRARQQQHHDDDDDGETALGAETERARAVRRLRDRVTRERERADAAEARLGELQTQLTAAQTTIGSVARLRQSLLEQAIRNESNSLVAAEAHGDVLKLIDLSDLQVGDDGTIDNAKVRTKVEKLVADKPYLAAKPTTAPPRALPGGGMMPPPPASNGFNELLRTAIAGE